MLKLVTMRRPHAIRTKRAYDSALPPISSPLPVALRRQLCRAVPGLSGAREQRYKTTGQERQEASANSRVAESALNAGLETTIDPKTLHNWEGAFEIRGIAEKFQRRHPIDPQKCSPEKSGLRLHDEFACPNVIARGLAQRTLVLIGGREVKIPIRDPYLRDRRAAPGS